MNKEWKAYYIYLEQLRISGITNMFGAAPYLQEHFDLDIKLATEILIPWMKNYQEIMSELKAENPNF